MLIFSDGVVASHLDEPVNLAAGPGDMTSPGGSRFYWSTSSFTCDANCLAYVILASSVFTRPGTSAIGTSERGRPRQADGMRISFASRSEAG
jgi:hypothetical protein